MLEKEWITAAGRRNFKHNIMIVQNVGRAYARELERRGGGQRQREA